MFGIVKGHANCLATNGEGFSAGLYNIIGVSDNCCKYKLGPKWHPYTNYPTTTLFNNMGPQFHPFQNLYVNALN